MYLDSMRPAQVRIVIGSRMRQLRQAAGVSLSRTAQMSGWDKSHLSRVECGATKGSRLLIEWYDAQFGAHQALMRQYLDLEQAGRQDRERTLRDIHHIPHTPRILAGTVPVDYDPADGAVLVTETIPDGAQLEPGQNFTKSWTLRNTGPITWHNRWLTRQGNPATPGWLISPHRVPVPDTSPGNDVTIILPLTAPKHAGATVAYFKLTDPHGRLYFPHATIAPLYCSIFVIH